MPTPLSIHTCVFVFPFKDPERETGIISVIMSDRDFAFIECADRDGKLFLHFSDFTDRNHEPRYDFHMSMRALQWAAKCIVQKI